MPTVQLPYRDAGYFSELICDYIDRKPELSALYGRYPTIDSLSEQMEEKGRHFTKEDRARLVSSLEAQYAGVNTSEATQDNIAALSRDDCFTITTGHQLNLFTGPLYFLYKIVSVINLCREMQQKHTDHVFVPVFWMASEDHDFDEINFFRLHGKKFTWEHEQGGAVGELDTDGLDRIVPLLEVELGSGAFSAELVAMFREAYTTHENLADATRYLANTLFGGQGLVVVDGNDRGLKTAFAPHVKKELLDEVTHQSVTNTSLSLEAMGYSRQVNPREINLFYLHEQGRKRIVRQGEEFAVVDTNTMWSEQAILSELEAHPERFSPNALLRPLYQEVILPNLCYIGGGGELAYWLQLKSCFDRFQVPFPVLLLRNSVLLASQKQWSKFSKFDLPTASLFQDWHTLSSVHVHRHSEIAIDFEPQRSTLIQQFAYLHELAAKTDPTFKGAVAAQEKKQLNGLDKLEKRLLKAQKRKMSDELARLRQLQTALFPNGSLQERGVNFAEFYRDQGPQLIDKLLQSLNPLDPTFTILLLD